MSILSYTELCELVEQGVIGQIDHDCINASSIDIHLGNDLIIERNLDRYAVVDPHKRTNFPQEAYHIGDGHYYDLAPGEFVLAHSKEVFNLPMDVSAEFRLKSSGARSGLNNLFACHCDAGWHGSTLTLELHNVLRFTAIRLTAGMRIGQMLFHKHTVVPEDRSYAARGRYLNDKSVSAVKL
ncbi:MAG: dCTP deaminase [Spirochaetes bacterium GWB1_59_5]|nr:MAG: dCTP deaminase [Spirochaetes bacterium GWB1_59_5]